jgi:hypothetical protein
LRGSSRGSSSTTSPTPRVRAPLLLDFFAYAARPGASAHRAARGSLRRSSSTTPRRAVSSSTTSCAVTSSCGHTGSTSATPCVTATCLAATLSLLRVRHATPRRRLPVALRRPFISTSFPN